MGRTFLDVSFLRELLVPHRLLANKPSQAADNAAPQLEGHPRLNPCEQWGLDIYLKSDLQSKYVLFSLSRLLFESFLSITDLGHSVVVLSWALCHLSIC